MARARDLMMEALRHALQSRRITPTRASKKAGLHGDALNAVFRGARNLALDEVDRILESNEISFEEILGYMASACHGLQRPLDPPAVVASLRDVQRACFPDLRIWLTLNPSVGSGKAPWELPPLLDEIERIRSVDREAALERTRIWVGSFRQRLRGASRGQAFRAEAVCDFALALGMWGSIACSLGLTNDASFAIEHALHLHAAFPLSRGYARLLRWATSLALPAGQPRSGVVLAERALLTLAAIGATQDQPKVLVSYANMKAYCGGELEAAEIANSLLNHPGSTADNLFAAHILKLQAALLQRDLETARQDLTAAFQLIPKIPASREAIWHWWSGRLEAACGNVENAKAIFCGLLAARSTLLETGDRFLIFLDLADLATPLGDLQTIRTEAGKLRALVPHLDVSPFNRALLLSLTQIVQHRLPEESELLQARNAIRKCVSARADSKPGGQPLGSGSGPNSPWIANAASADLPLGSTSGPSSASSNTSESTD